MLLHLTVLTQGPFTALRVCNDSVYIQKIFSVGM